MAKPKILYLGRLYSDIPGGCIKQVGIPLAVVNG